MNITEQSNIQVFRQYLKVEIEGWSDQSTLAKDTLGESVSDWADGRSDQSRDILIFFNSLFPESEGPK